jgi:hypothetical protein
MVFCVAVGQVRLAHHLLLSCGSGEVCTWPLLGQTSLFAECGLQSCWGAPLQLFCLFYHTCMTWKQEPNLHMYYVYPGWKCRFPGNSILVPDESKNVLHSFPRDPHVWKARHSKGSSRMIGLILGSSLLIGPMNIRILTSDWSNEQNDPFIWSVQGIKESSMSDWSNRLWSHR